MSNAPLVSILIPCHNAERWVAQSISSALAQSWPNKEVIVVDDGSTDRSLEIIRSFGNSVRVESGPNRGANIARNRLLELAQGSWLQFLDADDYLLETKVADQLASEPDPRSIDVIYSPMTIEPWHGGQASKRTALPVSSTDPWLLMARGQMPGTHAVLMRRSAVIEVGGWKPDQPCCQEHELFLRLLLAGKRFDYVPRAGAIYRHWSPNTVSNKDPSETVLRRLALIDTAEEYLTKTSAITPTYSDAFASQRIELARTLYRFNSSAAITIAARAARIRPDFKLQAAACFPKLYRILYNSVGFRTAEYVAALVRPWKRSNKLIASLELLVGEAALRGSLVTDWAHPSGARPVLMAIQGLLA